MQEETATHWSPTGSPGAAGSSPLPNGAYANPTPEYAPSPALYSLPGRVPDPEAAASELQTSPSGPDETADLLEAYRSLGLCGTSPAFRELIRTMESAARCDVRVLLEGESGTGKDLLARAIHLRSARRSGQFVAVDCGAIPEHLLESELFGHRRGAFTGATAARRGLMEEADHGTLFMDEITNLHYDLQAKLLRVLQDGHVRLLGGNTIRRVDVRIIAASSSSLRRMVEEGRFREDLYYRLHVFPVSVPALRDRRGDIPLLADIFLRRTAEAQRKSIGGWDPDLLRFLRGRTWPGNIRELENFVERLVTLAPVTCRSLGISLLPADFHAEFRRPVDRRPASECRSLPRAVAALETDLIREALRRHNGNQSRAAHDLGISERTIRYKIAHLGIARAARG